MSVSVDLRSAEVIADPFPALAELRERDPVHWSEGLGGWVLTRHDDVEAGLKDPRLSSDRIRPFIEHTTGARRQLVEPLGRHLVHWAVFTDPPVHTRLRGLMNKAFTSRAIGSLRPNIEEIVNGLLDDVGRKGGMDVIRDFAYPLPATVIADMLGVPRANVDLLKKWSDDLAAFVLTSRVNPERYEIAAAGIAEMTEYFESLLAERRRSPGGDLASGLIAAAEKGDVLSPEELVAACVFLLFAGHETTTQLIGNGLLALLRHPEQLAYLRAHADDRESVRNAVEEMLRWDGPILSSVRVARQDLELRGRAIRQGQRLILFNAAANRDPRVFSDPDRFDIRRDDAGRHVSFGYGIHFCLGAPLARLEGEIAFTALMRRFPRLELLEPEPKWSDSLLVRGLLGLPVGLGPAQAA